MVRRIDEVKDILGKTKFNQICRRLRYLKDRWADEKKFEELEGYRQSITTILPKGAEDISLGKKFELIFKYAGVKMFFYIKRNVIHWGQF